MSETIWYKNFIEFNDCYYFHPGYYIEELIETLGLSQAEFASRMDTSENTVSLLINAKQSLTPELASKLSRMTGLTARLWLGYQAEYDAVIAEVMSQESLESDKEIAAYLDYAYFIDHFNAPVLTCSHKQWQEKVKWLRRTLNLSSLALLKEPDLFLNSGTPGSELQEKDIVCANARLMLGRKQGRHEF